MIKIAPSILTSDFSRLYEEVKQVEDAGADLLHLDIMDGHFVPNITMGPVVLRSLKKRVKLPFDVHLMIQEPWNFIKAFSDVSDILTVHVEACSNIPGILKKIKTLNIKAGLALNPNTDVSSVTDYLKDIDMVTIMTVNPGFGGQKFMTSVLPKIKKIRDIITKGELNVDVEVDGGITSKNVGQVVKNGANVIVTGAAIFNKKTTVKDALKIIRDSAK